MNIELKNIQVSSSSDEQYPAFMADLYINDSLAAKTWNAGWGSATEYEGINEQGKRLVEKAEEFCKDQMPVEFKGAEGHGEFYLSRTLDIEIEQKVNNHLFLQSFQETSEEFSRDMIKYILVGKNADDYGIVDLGLPLAKIINNPRGAEVVKDELRKLARNMGKEQMILNTNIPGPMLLESGLNPKQYTPPIEQGAKTQQQKRAQRKCPGL